MRVPQSVERDDTNTGYGVDWVTIELLDGLHGKHEYIRTYYVAGISNIRCTLCK